MTYKRYTIREISRMTPKDICYLLNCKNRIIKQQEDKLWEIRLQKIMNKGGLLWRIMIGEFYLYYVCYLLWKYCIIFLVVVDDE